MIFFISIGARLDRVVTAHNPKNFAKNANIYCIDVDISENLEKHPKRFNKYTQMQRTL